MQLRRERGRGSAFACTAPARNRERSVLAAAAAAALLSPGSPFLLLALHSQVLSDPQKRDIYDVYGKEGLSAGLEVRRTLSLPAAALVAAMLGICAAGAGAAVAN